MARHASWSLMLTLSVLTATAAIPGVLIEVLRGELRKIAEQESRKYNCSYSIAFRSGNASLAVAAGTVEGRGARATDRYPFGSVTKMLTAASIMRLVADGVVSLEDTISPLVDPLLARMAAEDPTQGFASLADLWGRNVSNTTLRELLSMQTGIPDFDTASPFERDVDPLRKALYATPGRLDTPLQLMNLPWVRGKWKVCPPKLPICYSSTNFMLLGLVLAAKASDGSWQALDQAAFLRPRLRREIHFANTGNPRENGAVGGYDRTSYNQPKGRNNNHSNWEVAGVFSGWTASNVVATAQGVADLTWEIFGPPKGVAPAAFVRQMLPKGQGPRSIYGLGCFNLTAATGHGHAAVGHLGATYGYQSVTGYVPFANIALTVATNIETNYQPQPTDGFCMSYNAILGALLGRRFTCHYTQIGYYEQSCNCSESARDIVV